MENATSNPSISRYAIIAISMTILPVLVRIVLPAHAFIADDGYYYLVVARNLVDGNGSTFYHHVLTNGYHPLWLGVLAVTMAIVGPNLKAVIGLGIALSAITIFVVLRYLKPKTLPGAISMAVLVWLGFRGTSAFTGMESGLVLFLGIWALLVLYRCDQPNGLRLAAGTVLLILASAARLDFVFLAIPALLLAPGYKFRARALALTLYLAAGTFYVVANQLIFGTALPVSGEVKSLGGFQFNEPFARSLLASSVTRWLIKLAEMRPVTILVGTLILSIALVVCYACRTSRWDLSKKQAARLTMASVSGASLYLIKLSFFSSWLTWAWYGYMNGFLVVAALLLIKAFIDFPKDQVVNKRIIWSCCTLLIAYYFAATASIETLHDYSALNYKFYRTHEHLLATHNVAMGDRSGSLAYFSGRNNFVQLEGLVMNESYFQKVKKPIELTSVLCQLGADVLIAYEPDLGNYRDHRIPALRPALTQYKSAYVEVSHKEQIAKYRDDKVFPPTYYKDNVIYAWKLDCPSHQ